VCTLFLVYIFLAINLIIYLAGVGPSAQQNPAGMGQMGPGQHAAQMNRGMLPPNAPPNMGNPMGSTQQAHSPGYQQMGRPSSRPSTPGSQNMMPNPSPSLTSRVPPAQNGMGGQMLPDSQTEFMRIPAALISQLKQELGFGDKETSSLSAEEKVTIPHFLISFMTYAKQTDIATHCLFIPPEESSREAESAGF
jgi:hypothetical protein